MEDPESLYHSTYLHKTDHGDVGRWTMLDVSPNSLPGALEDRIREAQCRG